MNQFLEKMGFKPVDRVLITHIDDMGFCHAANVATEACLSGGSASCASVIVNAGWFLEAAHMAQHNLPDTNLEWVEKVTNCFLIRHPKKVILSYAKNKFLPERIIKKLVLSPHLEELS